MRVRIGEQTASLEDKQDLGSLSVVTDLIGASLGAAMTRWSLGEPDPDGRHVWLEPQALRALARGEGAWPTRFADMLRFAQDHGFGDSIGRVRAHIEPSTTGPVSGLPPHADDMDGPR